jgi:outer membrane immunogenic protein
MNNLALAASAAAIALAASATPAMAQYDRDSHFDGPYVSGTIGMAAKNNDNGDRIVFDTNGDGKYRDVVATTTGANAFGPGFCHGISGGVTPAAGCSGDENHWEFSGRIGYDKRVWNNLVGGLLVEVSGASSKDRVTAFSITPARYTLSRDLKYAVSLRGRVGYTPGGGALFYLTGGPAYAKVDHGFSTTNTTNAFTEVNDGKWIFGGQVGGGAEVMLTNNVSLGLEYLFNSYIDDKYHVRVTQGTAPATNPFILTSGATRMRPSNTNYDFHSLRASLSYQF